MNQKDGPVSSLFQPLPLEGNIPRGNLASAQGISEAMAKHAEYAPSGEWAAWGIPFSTGDPVLLVDSPVLAGFRPLRARWLIFLHTSDERPLPRTETGLITPMRGEGQLNEHAADYVVLYEDGAEERVQIRRRHAIGAFHRRWGENCFQAVISHKPYPQRAAHEQPAHEPFQLDWGLTQTRVSPTDWGPWISWLYAWENPRPQQTILGIRFEPVSGAVLVSAVSAGLVSEHPLRWRPRRKARLRLPDGSGSHGAEFRPDLDEDGTLEAVKIDLGQIISAQRRPLYPTDGWPESSNNQVPALAQDEILLEYTSHSEASFHLWDGCTIPVSQVEAAQPDAGGDLPLQPVPAATRRVTLRVVERESGRPVACKLHIHGPSGEYLAPLDRHRIPNPAWFEDYSADFSHLGIHQSTYIPGETVIDLPPGKVYVEVSKGFEMRPVRAVLDVPPDAEEIMLEIEKVLPWRERGWVTADTHVHFLSPTTARLEGAAEGVNVINLLASQWGELMTNVGDFDGQTTWGSKEAGGDGEYLVRVGTENRQHILGHISLLGYRGKMIVPMTTGGPDESAIGDPVEVLLTEWARQCKKQGGLVVLPHFPNPRAEHAASIVSGDVDALEMTSWGRLYGGIDPYSLSDWYRYLNCGYLVAAVGGTDKMAADTAVGTVRTYARIPDGQPFTYEAWMDAVRRAETFVTYGPLLEFAVDGKPMGRQLSLPPGGGTLDVVWEAASATIPTTHVELVVNGEIRESVEVQPQGGAGSWSVRVERSAWLALLVRGQYAGMPEIIAAHSSPVMARVEGSPLLAAADAVTILEQIEGALAYLDTVGTRAEDRAYKRMRLVLESAHRGLHNRLHQEGWYHDHNKMIQIE